MMARPKILIFDFGLGGISVYRAVASLRPDADYLYLADDLGFPYGPKTEQEVLRLVMDALAGQIARFSPDVAVIACNTASTLALPQLREKWPRTPFVGTVPAIKPAAERSKAKMISVLATPGTVKRDYTRALIDTYAFHCDVNLVGAENLAALAERFLREGVVDEMAVFEEIKPCFLEKRHGKKAVARTDAIVLACTHYPLLLDVFEKCAPWSVEWIDPAPAIARRADHLLTRAFPRPSEPAPPRPGRFLFTSEKAAGATLAVRLAQMGLAAEALEAQV